MGAGISVEARVAAQSDGGGVRVIIGMAQPPREDVENLCSVTWGPSWQTADEALAAARVIVASELLGGAPADQAARASAGDLDAQWKANASLSIMDEWTSWQSDRAREPSGAEAYAVRSLDQSHHSDGGPGAGLPPEVFSLTASYRRDAGAPSASSESPGSAPEAPRVAAPPLFALLQAAPLVHSGQPVDMLDLKAERDAIVGSIARAGRSVQLVCGSCTARRLRSLLTDGCQLLHYSGHGLSYLDRDGRRRTQLAFEDGFGATHALEVEKLTALVDAGTDGGAQGLKLVFVSACHSAMGGEAFIAAGVAHVVAVRREAQLQDKAACAFADQFYSALFRGRTVRQSFDIAKQAVGTDPSIVRAELESDKFVLLPVGSDRHDVALYDELPNGPLLDLSPSPGLTNLPAFFPLQFVGRQLEWQQLVSTAIRHEKRVITLVGGGGLGKSSLALATAHYLYERCTFPGGVFYVAARGAVNQSEVAAMILTALADARTGLGTELDVDESAGEEAGGAGAAGAHMSR